MVFTWSHDQTVPKTVLLGSLIKIKVADKLSINVLWLKLSSQVSNPSSMHAFHKVTLLISFLPGTVFTLNARCINGWNYTVWIKHEQLSTQTETASHPLTIWQIVVHHNMNQKPFIQTTRPNLYFLLRIERPQIKHRIHFASTCA